MNYCMIAGRRQWNLFNDFIVYFVNVVIVVLGALVQDGLMSEEDVRDVQKERETYGWQRGLSFICRLQSTKEHTVVARTVEILEKCGCTTEDTTVLKGGKATVYNVISYRRKVSWGKTFANRSISQVSQQKFRILNAYSGN